MNNQERHDIYQDQIKNIRKDQKDLHDQEHPEEKKKISKYRKRDVFQERYLIEAERMAQIGLPERQMCWVWGVDDTAISRWKKRFPALANALKRGQGARNRSLLAAMMENALTRHAPAVQIFLAKNWLGMRDITDVDTGQGARILIQVGPAMQGAKPDKDLQAIKAAGRLGKGGPIKILAEQAGGPSPEQGEPEQAEDGAGSPSPEPEGADRGGI